MVFNNKIDSSKVIFLVGSSGTGKDTIIKELKNQLTEMNVPVLIPKRRITRTNHESENFISVSEEEVFELLKKKKFLFHWYSYQTQYGYLADEIFPYLDGEKVIILNISRTIAFNAKELFPDSKLIEISTNLKIASNRIKVRKRDSDLMIEERIKRMREKVDLPRVDLTLENNFISDLSSNIKKIIQILKIHEKYIKC